MNLIGDDYTKLINAIGGRYPRIQVLSLLNVELRDRPQSRDIVTRFLAVMSNLSYLRITGDKLKYVFEALLDDARRLDPKASLVDGPRLIVCPKMQYLEFQGCDTKDVIRLGTMRKRLNVPLLKIYVNELWVPHLTPVEQTALRDICDLYITPSKWLLINFRDAMMT